ncbi:hypothetical protein ES703_99461 [subsurface metagenome]
MDLQKVTVRPEPLSAVAALGQLGQQRPVILGGAEKLAKAKLTGPVAQPPDLFIKLE